MNRQRLGGKMSAYLRAVLAALLLLTLFSAALLAADAALGAFR